MPRHGVNPIGREGWPVLHVGFRSRAPAWIRSRYCRCPKRASGRLDARSYGARRDYSGPAPLQCRARLCAGMCNCRGRTRLGAGPPMRRYCTKRAMAGRSAASCRHRRRHSRPAAPTWKFLLSKRGVEASHRAPIGPTLPISSGNDGDIAALYGFRSRSVKSAKNACTTPATESAPRFRFRGNRNLIGPLSARRRDRST